MRSHGQQGILCAVLAVVWCVSGHATPAETYHWPLELPRELSSSFGEYRTGRFHAGIDLRTGGVIGRPVFAAADGHVSRVRCSPWGYGKAIYVQFHDGNSAVYAHLDDYYEELREYVRAAQHQSNAYTVDLYPDAGQFPVRKGQQIALSGRTGVGPPHLHYEPRDSANRPFNPRLIGIQWPDTTRPVINGLSIMPDGGAGMVQGGYTPAIIEFTHLGSGRYRSETVAVSGRIAFGVDVIDPGNDGLRLGVHILRATVEGAELFRVQHDYLSYDDMHHGAVSYHPFLMDKGRFLLLWRWPNNTTALYDQSPGDGWFEMPDRPVEVIIEAVDFMGNSTELVVPLEPQKVLSAAAHPKMVPEGKTDTDGSIDIQCYGTYAVVTARFPSPEMHAPALLIESGMHLDSQPFTHVSDMEWQVAFSPSQTAAYTLRIDHPRIPPQTKTVHALLRGTTAQRLSLGDVQVRVQPHSPFGILFVHAEPVKSPRSHAIPLRGEAWRVWPQESPIDAQVELSLPIVAGDGVNPSRTALFRDTGRGWRYVSNRRAGDRLIAAVRTFGIYAVLEDTHPPAITDIRPVEGYQAQTQRPIIRATTTDVGSGMADFSVTANGKWLLVLYDPDEDRIEWERDHPLSSGAQELVFTVKDNVGNVTTARRTVYIP